MKLGLEGAKRVKKFFYRIPITVLQDTVKYDCFMISSDEDLQVMFLCRRQFLEVRTPELLAKLVDVVSSSGGLNRNTTTLATPAGSSSRPAVGSSSVPVYQPVVQPVASPSFAVDLNGSVGDKVGSRKNLLNALLGVAPLGVGDGLLGDAEEDGVEPDMIDDDSGDDIGASEPALAVGGSSSVTQQYSPHFSSLDLDAMRQEGVFGHSVGFRARVAEGTTGLTEFQVGQQFQDKDEALLSVKTYSIRRGVQYKVVESDYRRYVGKCSEFGNGCTWLIRLSLRQRKGIWEVKRYNGPHTCLATSISSDHRSLDYHVISAFIMPMVRADASVSIKVLLNATAAHFGFRPTYRRVWMAKQKVVALIYGDWDESYNELPRWVLGVQLTMPGTVAVLRTSPVRVGGQVDESQAYFHRLFWTFPPCIEAFRHCKPLVSIDGTHLYGKYGGTLLIAIVQDGNSNILPVAFALVEGENAESWTFFLSHLRQHVTPQPGLLVISDRHNGIKPALEAPDGGWLPPSVYHAFCIRHVAANFALTFKGKDARRLLVNAAYATPTISFSLGSYRVSLASWTCDCGYFQALHFPCQHALACCAYSRVNWTTYVHSMYRISSVFSVYQMGFTPPIPEGFWPSYDGPTVIPDPDKRRAREGHPRSTRIRTNMDEADPNRPKRCGLCR
ncbi:uncharacterized protein LOC107493529 [Arachis duranensis]|uniref:Uncharacterized protein LOC107493529 n=1 Tax=Arachis duranensis TaxID=130453 RepID=A0A6P4DPE0_ARADU|nr:uncharacterized protein LOC107493529 [Arachis duranensis]